MSYFRQLNQAVAFGSETAGKTDMFVGPGLFVGLNCFEPGQMQRIHAHADADKVYLVVSGKARMTVGDETGEATAGDLVWAPAGIPHGVIEVLERTVMVVCMSR